jgi:hypothetical protein
MKTLQNDKRKTVHVPKSHTSQRIEEMKIQLPAFNTGFTSVDESRGLKPGGVIRNVLEIILVRDTEHRTGQKKFDRRLGGPQVRSERYCEKLSLFTMRF